jgi:hypothetical protein
MRWCRGLQSIGRRALDERERRSLRSRAAWLLIAGIAASLAVVAPIAVASIMWNGGGGARAELDAFLADVTYRDGKRVDVTVAIVLFGAAPFLLLLARDAFRGWLRARRDLRDGAVEIFVGRPDLPGHESFWRGLAASPPVGVPLPPHRVELRASGAVHSVNDAPPRGRARVDVTVLAEAGERPSAYIGAEMDVEFRQRHMTGAEAEELERIVAFLRWSGAWKPALTAFAAAVGVVLFRARVFDSWIPAALFGGIAVLGVGEYVVRLLRAHRLLRDRRMAKVIIVTPPRQPSREVLPNSRALWTFAGRPAPWREIGSGR